MGRSRRAAKREGGVEEERVQATLDSVLRNYGRTGPAGDASEPWRRKVPPLQARSVVRQYQQRPTEPSPSRTATRAPRMSRPAVGRPPHPLLFMVVALAAVLGLVVALSGGGGHRAAPVRPVAKAPRPTVLPLRVLWHRYGARPTIMVRVGHGPEVPVLLDTGSTGLHIYAPGVRRGRGSGVAIVTRPDSATYFDGTVQRGVIGRARLTIDGVKTTTSVPFGLITSAGCVHHLLRCPSAAGIHSWIARGEYGILGIGLSRNRDRLTNPLLMLPRSDGHTWSIALHGTHGSLTLGAPLPAHPLAHFALASDGRDPSGHPAWKDTKARVCWAAVGLRGAGCEPTAFDTGSTTMFWYGGLMSHATTYPGSILVVPGTYIAAWQPGSSKGFWSFTSGIDASKNTVLALNTGHPGVIADVQAFLTFRITYDAERGEIFVARRA